MSDNAAIQNLLKQSDLKPLIEQAFKIKQANQVLQIILPQAFQGMAQVTSVKSGTLIVDVPNASIHTRLRFDIPALLSQLRQHKGLEGIASIKLRVQAVRCEPVVEEKALEVRTISVEASEQLKAAAETLEDDALKAALLSLARHVKAE